MEYVPYTYVVTFTTTGQRYYGVSFACHGRKVANPTQLWTTYFTSSNTIRSLIRKYGATAFVVEVRRTFKTKEEALSWESKTLTRLRAASNPQWFNRSNGGRHFYQDEEARRKISIAKKGKPSLRRGIPMTSEQKIKLSTARTGIRISEEHNAKRSARMQGVGNHMYGTQHSDATREKMAISARRRSPSKLRNRPKTAEQRAKQSATMKRKYQDKIARESTTI